MKTWTLRTKILLSFYTVVFVFALAVAVLGYYIINRDIMERAQAKVRNDLNSAREVYQKEIERIRDVVRFTAVRFFIKEAISDQDHQILLTELSRIRQTEAMDVLTLVDASGKVMIRSRIPTNSADSLLDDKLIHRVLSSREVVAGTFIVPRSELIKEGEDLAEKARIRFVPTLKAKPTTTTEETSGMMIKVGAPVLGHDGRLLGILYGGSLLNRNYKLVDKIKDIIYENTRYEGKDIGTATIFQGDLRISTNVKAREGHRAIGTRVSDEVYQHVLVEGVQWVGRAFVVTHWYKTAYEPIKDIDNNIIGMLYVGILEQPFVDMIRNVFLLFLTIVLIAMLMAGSLALLLVDNILRPVGNMVKATSQLSKGDLGYEVETETGTIELNMLAKSFNEMSIQLRDREDRLKHSNEELAALNKTYLDLVGFVSHELKGIVATTIMNTAAVRDELLGQINPNQKKSLQSATRNLNYLRETVRKFLDLSRIEKGELELNRTDVRLREDVFDPCLETFAGELAEKQMEVMNDIDPGITVLGDVDLLRIAANNLIGNAIKYGLDRGKIILHSNEMEQQIQIEVYNDARPIKEDEKAKLFKKFSRLRSPVEKDVKGTGLGLFVTKEIILKHGGDIWIESRENGNSFIFRIEKRTFSL